MKKTERIITIIMLLVISLSNVAAPVSYAAELVSSSSAQQTPSYKGPTPLAPRPAFHQPDTGSVLGDSTSLFVIGSGGSDTQNSASKRIPLRMQQLPKKVYQTDEDVQLAVTNPDDAPFTTSVLNTKGQAISVPISQSNNGTISNVNIIGSNAIIPGRYKIQVTDSQGDVLTQDFSWGVLAMNFDKSTYHPGETGNISFAVLNDQGDMVCDAQLKLEVRSEKGELEDTLSTTNASSSANLITVNPQCQKHDFSLQPDYQTSYTFPKTGTYTMQLTAVTSGGTHSITNIVPVLNNTSFDIQRVSATRIYPPDTYPMTINIKANRDFSGTVTETVPQDFVITPASESALLRQGSAGQAQFISGNAQEPTSYDNMQTMYLNGQNPALQLQQVLATKSAALAMPFHGDYPITQGFGAQMTDPTLQAFYTHYGLAGHDGVDFGVPMNTPLYAVDEGTVIWSGPGDYGITIIIGHVWGESYYGHLSNTAVAVGQHVVKGELIGFSGESGEATGPHLHFGMKPNNPDMQNGYYGKVDPLPYLPYNQAPKSIASLGPTLPLLNLSPVLGASTSASQTPSSTPTQSPTVIPLSRVTGTLSMPIIAPTTLTPTSQASVSATPAVSQNPTATPSAVPQTQSTTMITESTTPPVNTAISVLDKQIFLNEQLANSTQTEKVKVIFWQVSLKKGQTTSLGYNFKAPPESPQFYLFGPMQFYQNGSNKVVFQEQRQWQVASDDVGVEWYSNTANTFWNGYSWQYRKKLDISLNNVYATPSAQTVDFMDSGGDATNATSGNTNLITTSGGFYSATSGTVAYDTTNTNTGPGSIKFTTGGSGAVATVNANGILADAGRRISVYYYFTTAFSNLSAADNIMSIQTSGGTQMFALQVTTGGVLKLVAGTGSGTVIGTGATLTTGSWYRISVGYKVTNATTYAIKVYVNGSSSISVSNSTTLGTNTSSNIVLGWTIASVGNNQVMNIDDVYVDSDADLSDTGDVHVTAKRPNANGAANGFTTQIGSGGSGYPGGCSAPSCHASQVNERPLSTTNGWSTASNATTEEYTVEGAGVGDVNIPSNAGLISDQSWIYLHSSAVCTTGNAKIVNNGVSTNITLPTSNAMLTNYASITTFPSGNTAVGITTCTTGAPTVQLFEAGIQVAYIPDLTNFPVLVNLSSDTDLHNHAQSSGNDILFTDSTGETLLPFEIENYTSSTGSLQAWVNISSLSTANDTIIYMYFGNPSASSQANVHGTWNSNYGGVWHFSSSGGTLGLSDSTSNGNTLSQGSADHINSSSTGQIDGSALYNDAAQDGYLDAANNAIFNPGTASFSGTAWVNASDLQTTTVNAIIAHIIAGRAGWEFYLGGDGGCSLANSICFWDGTSDTGVSAGFTNSTWTQVGFVKSGTTITFYVNGSKVGTPQTAAATIPNETTTENIGWDLNSTTPFIGTMDELEYSQTGLSPGWIKTEYNNQSAPGSFETLGNVETDIYAPLLSQMLRHGQFFGTVGVESGVLQPFTW